MALPAKRPATYADILALPEHVLGELIGGELVVSPRPAPRHSAASSALGASLGPPFQFGDGGPGGWWILDEPELHLGEDVVVPDLAGWRRARMPALPDGASFELAPDWVCEVLSPSTGRIDRTRKLPIYARAGIPFAWLIDPALQTLEVYRLEGANWVLLGTHGGAETVRAAPFEAVAFQLGRLWGQDR
jgi:Uma2 family endonuclease